MAAKRLLDDSDQNSQQPNNKRMKTRPTFASVIQEVVAVKFLDSICSALEPMLRKVVNEEVENGLRRCSRSMTRSPSLRIQALEPSSLRLVFHSEPALPIFTGSKIAGEDGNPLKIFLVDTRGDVFVPTPLPYPLRVEIVVLDGDFPSRENETSWSADDFGSNIVKEREGKRPLLAGELSLTMRDGVATVGDLEFTDNSSWIRCRRFRLGARVVSGDQGVRISEAMTKPFMVKDHRGELYKKHYPPALDDDVWRLEKIGKDGIFHKRLAEQGIKTVQDFLKMSTVDINRLRKILGAGMSEKMWDATYKHASTCDMGNKLYLAQGPNYTLLLNPICQVVKAVIDGEVCPVRNISNYHKSYITDLVKYAYGSWSSLQEVDAAVNELPLLTQGDLVDQCSNHNQPQSIRGFQRNAFLTEGSDQAEYEFGSSIYQFY
nr:protein SAR DEFICIENT 1-like [Ipomoea batatas]